MREIRMVAAGTTLSMTVPAATYQLGPCMCASCDCYQSSHHPALGPYLLWEHRNFVLTRAIDALAAECCVLLMPGERRVTAPRLFARSASSVNDQRRIMCPSVRSGISTSG